MSNRKANASYPCLSVVGKLTHGKKNANTIFVNILTPNPGVHQFPVPDTIQILSDDSGYL